MDGFKPPKWAVERRKKQEKKKALELLGLAQVIRLDEAADIPEGQELLRLLKDTKTPEAELPEMSLAQSAELKALVEGEMKKNREAAGALVDSLHKLDASDDVIIKMLFELLDEYLAFKYAIEEGDAAIVIKIFSDTMDEKLHESIVKSCKDAIDEDPEHRGLIILSVKIKKRQAELNDD